MRMWMIPARFMCSKHLLLEHNSLHRILKFVNLGYNLRRCVYENKIEFMSMISRHKNVSKEMALRGLVHSSPLEEKHFDYAMFMKIPQHRREIVVNVGASAMDLAEVCGECKRLMNLGVKKEVEK